MKKKACKRCKVLFDGGECPVCKGTNHSTNWQGRLFVINPQKSVIAQKIGIQTPGEYAIKVK